MRCCARTPGWSSGSPLGAGPLLVVAGLTWWPAWLLFPLAAGAVLLAVRPLLAQLAERKVVEEIAWTDHAAAMEEGIAARDDLRTSLGQAYLLRRCAELSAEVHARFRVVVSLEARISRRTGVLLHALLAAVAIVGFALVSGGQESTATFVTLFLVTTTFVGQIDQVARHMPDLQAGIGALVRLRGLLATEPEPVGGAALPDAVLGARPARRCTSPTTRAPSRCATSTCGSPPARRARWSAAAAPASPRWPPWSPAPSSPSRRRSSSAGSTSATSTCTRCAPRSVWSPSAPRSWPAPSPRTSPSSPTCPAGRVQDAVDELGLTDWVASLPDGLDTLLGPSGTTLSAGEEQLVAFARLLVRDVRVVILDEATARMDPVTEARVVAASQRLLVGRTGLLVAHRLTTTARADHVAVLDAGRVVQHGPPRGAGLAARAGSATCCSPPTTCHPTTPSHPPPRRLP